MRGVPELFCNKHNVEKIYMSHWVKPAYICRLCRKEEGDIYLQNHKEQTRKTRIEYRKRNRDKINAQRRKREKDNPQKYFLKDLEYREKNKEHIREYRRNYIRNKRKSNIKFNIDTKVGNLIYAALRENKNGRKWESLVDYTLDDLVKRLKKTMPNGYSWEDLLNGNLHIDHIIPKSLFQYNDPDQISFKECWALDNLRLLSAEDNVRKQDKFDVPFQLYLPI